MVETLSLKANNDVTPLRLIQTNDFDLHFSDKFQLICKAIETFCKNANFEAVEYLIKNALFIYTESDRYVR